MNVVNPATGAVVRELPEDDFSAVSSKYAHARAAQPAWAATPLEVRLGTIARFRASIGQEVDRLALVLTRETGKPVAQARNEIRGLVADGGRLDFFLRETARALAEEVVAEDGTREIIRHEPLGVVANVSAWNYPYFVGANAFVPALLCGNTVVYKPSEYATMTGLEIARLLHAAGVPQDVFVPVVGGGQSGRALVDQPVDGVFFTGSYATGRAIATAVAPRMIKVQLELGGKDPTYVTDEVDPRKAAESLADGAFYNNGQSCCSVERIYVHRAVAPAFVEAFLATVRGFVVGDPEDDATYLGPVARAPQLDVLAAQVADALAKGATLAHGGSRVDRPGSWFEPTVLLDVDHRMAVMRDESFGPIIGIQVVDGDDEAVRLMNDTEYGLTAGVYGADPERAKLILSQVDAGTVYWNCCDRVSPRLPWTGRKHSGIGSTLSRMGIQAFARPKAWHCRVG